MKRGALRGALGLATYRALSNRQPSAPYEPANPRPAGTLVWLHAAEPGSATRLEDLALRIIAADSALHVLVTVVEGTARPMIEGVQTEVLPGDTIPQTEAFLDHWSPQLCLWAWGGLQPNLLIEAEARSVPLYLIDGGPEGFDSARERWLPEISRRLLDLFERVLVRSEEARARVLRFGIAPDRVEVTPPLLPGAKVLPAAQSDLDELSAALAGRPVWYADGITVAEVPQVLSAQRAAQRSSYRLLLVANPADSAAEARLEALCSEEAMRIQRWSDGALPEEGTSVLMADLPGEAGLWCRLAPLAFMGGSLTSGARGRDPMVAAALGAAVLYGPGVGDHLSAYRRLADAGAARIVRDGASLAAAVTRLIAPDQTARMALAGWEVVTEGAAATDRIVELSLSALDDVTRGAD